MQNSHYQTKNDIQKDRKHETIAQLAHRHIFDKNHTTTDEELRNAIIEFNASPYDSVDELSELSDEDNNTVFPSLPFEKSITSVDDGETEVESRTGSAPNPYDVLK
jgi:hypothetical protein